METATQSTTNLAPSTDAPPELKDDSSKPLKPKTYLAGSIISFFLNPLFGIIALIYSHRVSSRYDAGDYEGSVRASRAAKFCVTLVMVLLLIMLALTAFAVLAHFL